MAEQNNVPEECTRSDIHAKIKVQPNLFAVDYDVIYETLSDIITCNGWDNCGDGIDTSELADAVYFELTGHKSEHQLEREAEDADDEEEDDE